MSEQLSGVTQASVTGIDSNSPQYSPNACHLQVESSKKEAKSCGVKIKFVFGKKSPSSPSKFEKGQWVEASSDEKGFEGSWYTATIVDYLGNDKYLIEYLTLMTEDETKCLREEVYSRYIRPNPPHLPPTYLNVLDRVDAWYNDGWWEGVISKVLRGYKYIVYFSTTYEELTFDLANLRPHQDWISGKWVLASKYTRPHNADDFGIMMEINNLGTP